MTLLAHRVDEILLRALEMPEAERRAFLDRECGADARLRREVEGLLEIPSSALDRAERNVFELLPGGLDHDGGIREPDHQLGPYAVEEKLGEGGTSVVFRGRRRDPPGSESPDDRPPDDRPVALKVLKRGMDSDAILRRFEREGQILSSLDHPGIAGVLGGGASSDHRPFLVLELIDGEPIDVYCRRLELDVADRIRLLLPACEAIAYAHRNLVLHRDLKPAHIRITGDGAVKILDFGVSKLLDSEGKNPLTVTAGDQRMVTPEYAAPELLAMAPCTTAVDVYSLGVVLYELLTGRRPLERQDDRLEFYRRVLEDPPSPPSRYASGLSADVDAVVMKALAKEPAQRYLSVEDLSEDLRRCLELRPVAARGGGVGYRLARMIRRHARVGAAALAIIGIVSTVALDRMASRRQLREQVQEAAAWEASLGAIFNQLDVYHRPLTAEELVERIGKLAPSIENPVVKSTLLHMVGRVHTNRGDRARGLSMIEEAAFLLRAHLPPNHPRRLRAEVRLGDAMTLAGRFDEAEPILRAALEAWESQGETHTFDHLAARLSYGRALQTLGRTEAAEPIMRGVFSELEARSSRGALDSRSRSLLLESAMLLGTALIEAGRPGDAVPVLQQAWKRAEEEWSGTHPRTLYIGRVLAEALFNTGDISGSLALAETIAEGTRRILGEHHDTGLALILLGRIAKEKGDFPLARGALVDARDMFAKTLPADHRDIEYVEALLLELPSPSATSPSAMSPSATSPSATSPSATSPSANSRAVISP